MNEGVEAAAAVKQAELDTARLHEELVVANQDREALLKAMVGRDIILHGLVFV